MARIFNISSWFHRKPKAPKMTKKQIKLEQKTDNELLQGFALTEADKKRLGVVKRPNTVYRYTKTPH